MKKATFKVNKEDLENERVNLVMSQIEFAKYLGIGSTTYSLILKHGYTSAKLLRKIQSKIPEIRYAGRWKPLTWKRKKHYLTKG